MNGIQKQIEGELKTWSQRMVEKYNWLTIEYEYSFRDECFLVSFSGDYLLTDEEFNRGALDFENELVEKYGDDEPLFTDNEELFELTSNKTTIRYDNKRN